MVSSRQVLLCWGYKTNRQVLPCLDIANGVLIEPVGKLDRSG